MKKYIPAVALAVLIPAIIIGCKTRFNTTKSDYKATATPAAFERGKELAFAICAGCHYDRHTDKFIGKQIQDVPGIAGHVYSANLTHSKKNGVTSHYSDAELKYLFKTGIARDGSFLEYMLRPNMADEDINAIIAFLRSDDPSLRAADTTVGLTHFTFIGKMYMNMHAKPLPENERVLLPPNNAPVTLGYYLVDNLACFHCHSGSLTKLDLLHPNQTKGYLAGGARLSGMNGQKVTAPNITPDKKTGIGNYSREQFRAALAEGRAPDRELKPPMPKFAMLKTSEIDAIYAYLQTVPAKEHNTK
ncbi:MAG TPA: c-type cytochrome [Mucilaginibacter sp.]|jgi:mono/diheme cytochrome c family protein|nr:c-type cytochrome [Mucilaginibacter sp.]